jgi:Flp pilus assembly protein TadG
VSRWRARELGQAMVEFSLVFIIFMACVVGLIEAGRAAWNYNTLSNAVREGTRYGIVHGSASTAPAGPAANNAQIEARVEEQAPGLAASRLTVTSSWPDGGNAAGNRVRVTGSYQFETMFGSWLGIGPVTMTATSTMTITH